MPIIFEDVSDLQVEIEGITCNFDSKSSKERTLEVIRQINADEALCIERHRYNNPNKAPFDWEIVPDHMGNGLSILKGGQVQASLSSSSQHFAALYSALSSKINKAKSWCRQSL